MRVVVVTGGRAYTNAHQLNRVLNALHNSKPIDVLIQGCARGADTMAANWARATCVPCLHVPANWDEYGKSAGFERNDRMLTLAIQVAHDNRITVVAFPGGNGTRHCKMRAKERGLTVHEVQPND